MVKHYYNKKHIELIRHHNRLYNSKRLDEEVYDVSICTLFVLRIVWSILYMYLIDESVLSRSTPMDHTK